MENILLQKYEFGQRELQELLVYCFFLFMVPLLFGHLNNLPTQFFVGTAVNSLLFSSAVYLSGWKNIFPVVLPSIGAYFTGIIFGVNTSFLLYFIPFIWLGNFIYLLGVKRFFVKERRTFFGMIVPSILKSVLLFSVALIFVFAGLVPDLFLIAMGPMQLITAVSGAVLGFGFTVIRKKT